MIFHNHEKALTNWVGRLPTRLFDNMSKFFTRSLSQVTPVHRQTWCSKVPSIHPVFAVHDAPSVAR